MLRWWTADDSEDTQSFQLSLTTEKAGVVCSYHSILHGVLFLEILMLAILCLSSILSTSSHIVSQYSFSTLEYRFVITHQSGGRTKEQAKRQLNIHLTGEVVFITNGGYFAPDWNPIDCVDLVMTKDIERVPYLLAKSRPILAVGDYKTRIFTGDNGIAYQKLQKYKPAGKFRYAIAGDSAAIEPNRKTLRSIVVVKGYMVTFFVLGNADQQDCNKFISSQHLVKGEYIFLDGGMSLMANASSPSHLAVMTRFPKIAG